MKTSSTSSAAAVLQAAIVLSLGTTGWFAWKTSPASHEADASVVDAAVAPDSSLPERALALPANFTPLPTGRATLDAGAPGGRQPNQDQALPAPGSDPEPVVLDEVQGSEASEWNTWVAPSAEWMEHLAGLLAHSADREEALAQYTADVGTAFRSFVESSLDEVDGITGDTRRESLDVIESRIRSGLEQVLGACGVTGTAAAAVAGDVLEAVEAEQRYWQLPLSREQRLARLRLDRERGERLDRERGERLDGLRAEFGTEPGAEDLILASLEPWYESRLREIGAAVDSE